MLILFLFIISFHVFPQSCALKYPVKCRKNDPAVKNFQELLKIDTSEGKNLGQTVTFFKRLAAELGLPFAVYYPDGIPISVITWYGANRSLPSIVLNSHVDVVPALEKLWKFPPFSGYIDEKCNIHGRGAQDTKGVTIQYIEAIRKLIQSNVTLQRTIHVTVMPDEETGGYKGIKPFVKTKEFRALNVGFALDEGLTSPENVLYASNQDKRPWQMKFTVFGEAGHGSGMPNTTAMAKMYRLLSAIMKFREEQDEIRKLHGSLDYGYYTSLNVNRIWGGYTTNVNNVIPSQVSCVVDMRLAVKANIADVESMVESWRTSVGNDTLLEFIRRDVVSAATPLQCNPFWQAMKHTVEDFGLTVTPIVLPATTDMVVLRNMGIPALGFATRIYTPSLLHANEEYLNVDIFLKGIDIYVALLESMGNVRDFSHKI